MERFRDQRTWLGFPLAVVTNMTNDQGGNLAAIIAYYGQLSLLPPPLVITAILGLDLAGDPSLKAEVLQPTERSFPARRAISERRSKEAISRSAWVSPGRCGRGSIATERAMNIIWHIPMAERPNLWLRQLRSLAMLGI